MTTCRRSRNRAGVIVFLEFAATLPIFFMLFVACISFHRHYQNTRFAYSEARLGVDVHLDEHHSGRSIPSLFQNERKRRQDGLATMEPAVSHLMVNEFEARAVREVRAHGFQGRGTATGYHRSSRDAWTHHDIEKQVERDSPGGVSMGNGVESMPFIFHSRGKGPLVQEFLRL